MSTRENIRLIARAPLSTHGLMSVINLSSCPNDLSMDFMLLIPTTVGILTLNNRIDATFESILGVSESIFGILDMCGTLLYRFLVLAVFLIL